MATIIAFRLRPGEIGVLDLAVETRLQIYRYVLIDHGDTPIPIHRTCIATNVQDHFAISPRSLSAQLLQTCHHVLLEAYAILYTENNFTLFLDNNVVKPRAIPLLVTSGNISGLHRITIGLDSISLLRGRLVDLLLWLPFLEVLGVDGNLLRTIDFYRPSEPDSNTAMQRCIDQSIGLFLSKFGGVDLSRGLLSQYSSLMIEYTFGVAVDLVLQATGEVVRGVPKVSLMVDQRNDRA